MTQSTLVLTRRDVLELLDPIACIDAVEAAFRQHAEGRIAPGILSVHVEGGGFHIKTAAMLDAPRYFAAKINANFPANPGTAGLPTIQGAILLFDAANGRVLAVMDSAEITALRTAATTAVAVRHLARRSASTVTLIGCGVQAASQLRAVAAVRDLRHIHVADLDRERAERFARSMADALNARVEATDDVPAAVAASEICITCTPARRYIVEREWVRPGTFIAGVGADNEHKQEIDPRLFRSARVVVDSLEQCAAIGDLHHALDSGDMTQAEVHAELGAVVAKRAPARQSEDEIVLFDSTGVALTDVAAAARVYESALERGRGTAICLQ